MELGMSLFVSVAMALVAALLSAGIYAVLAKFMRIGQPRFPAAFGALAWSSLIGMVVGLVVAFLMQRSNQGFPTVQSIWGKMAAQYVTTLLGVVIFSKTMVQSARTWTAVLLPPAVLFAALLYAVSHPTLTFAREIEQRLTCHSHLRQIGITLMLYSENNHDNLPSSLDDLRSLKDFSNIHEVLRCPSASAPGIALPHYEYHPRGTHYTDEVPIAWDKLGNHSNGRNVLFRNSVVRWMTEEEFAQLQEKYKTP